MKRLIIVCVALVGFCLMKVPAFSAHYASDVAPPTKTFVDTYYLPLGEQVTIDIYLGDFPHFGQNSGGVWLDFSGSNSQIAYVSAGRCMSGGAEGCVGPWTDGAGVIVNEPAGPGTLLLQVSSLGGAVPDLEGDMIVGRVVFEMIGTGEASVIFSTIPEIPTWNPFADADAFPHTLIITDDFDGDGIANGQDNCPDTPNGPNGGTCTAGVSYKIARPCMSDSECGDGGLCSMNQEDSNQDGIGDACYLCEADFNCDGNVDGGDAGDFLAHFGRSTYYDPCTNAVPCQGDFNCDNNVDGSDVGKFREDFFRSIYNNPCPACEVGDWCVY